MIFLRFFVISETRLDDSFPDEQLTMSTYEIRTRRDRDKYEVGLSEFTRKSLLIRYGSLNIKVNCSEVAISNKNCRDVTRVPQV